MNFSGVITVDLTKHGEVVYNVPQCNRLWLPKYVMQGNAVKGNRFGLGAVVVSIRVQTQQNDRLPWSLQDGYMNSLSGPFDRLIIEVISNPNADAVLYLSTGTDAAGGHCNNDGLSPVIGGGASPSFGQFGGGGGAFVGVTFGPGGAVIG